MPFPICQPCNVLSTASHVLLPCCSLLYSSIGGVSGDSLSGLVASCSAISFVQYCWYLTNIMYMGEYVCEPV